MGMCIVDMHRLYRNKLNDKYSDIDILEFSDLICKKLIVRSRRQNGRLALLEKQNTSKQCSFAAIAKCHYVRRIAATLPLEDLKTALMSTLNPLVKL
jgi:hypothetical protein